MQKKALRQFEEKNGRVASFAEIQSHLSHANSTKDVGLFNCTKLLPTAKVKSSDLLINGRLGLLVDKCCCDMLLQRTSCEELLNSLHSSSGFAQKQGIMNETNLTFQQRDLHLKEKHIKLNLLIFWHFWIINNSSQLFSMWNLDSFEAVKVNPIGSSGGLREQNETTFLYSNP